MYGIPKACPRCGSKTALREMVNIFTTGIPLRNGLRFRILNFNPLFQPRFLVKYRCEACGFQGKYDDRLHSWKPRT